MAENAGTAMIDASAEAVQAGTSSVGSAAFAAVALAVTLAVSQPSQGQVAQPRPSGAALETIQIRSNVYAIFGAGSNIVMEVGEDGVILVDSGPAATADKVVQAVKAITNAPIRLILNTSAHPDHVGGNEKVSAAGVQLNPDSFSDAPRATPRFTGS